MAGNVVQNCYTLCQICFRKIVFLFGLNESIYLAPLINFRKSQKSQKSSHPNVQQWFTQHEGRKRAGLGCHMTGQQDQQGHQVTQLTNHCSVVYKIQESEAGFPIDYIVH